MTQPITIRKAVSDDAVHLTELAVRSKAHWGYSTEFMEACFDELSVTANDIKNRKYRYIVAESNEKITGFYALENLASSEIELGALFVEPSHIGCGVGKALIEDAKQRAIELGANCLDIQGDPNAEYFYRVAGGVLTGQKQSESIPGRYLPTFRIPLTEKNIS